MKRTTIVFVLLVAAVIVVAGFYRGWFSFKSDGADNKSNVTFSVDSEKFQADRKSAVAGAQDLGREIKDQVAGPGEKSMDGTMVGVTGDKLTMTNKEGKEHSHALTADVKVTCDGKVCKASELKVGMKIRVSLDSTDAHAATRVEALDKNLDFEKVG